MACQGFIQYTKLIAASSELCLIIYQGMQRFPYGHLWLTGRNGVMTPQIERCLSNILPKKTYTNTQQRENIMSARILNLLRTRKSKEIEHGKIGFQRSLEKVPKNTCCTPQKTLNRTKLTNSFNYVLCV